MHTQISQTALEQNTQTPTQVLATLGELHLEQCMERLQRRVSGEITVSEPITMFKETCKKIRGEIVRVLTSNKRFQVVMSCGRLDEAKENDENELIRGPSSAPSTRLVMEKSDNVLLKTFRASIVSGFHLAVTQGPLCHEPIHNVRFVIHSVEELESEESSSKKEDDEIMNDEYGPYAGQILSAVKKACFESFLKAEPRIEEPIFRCVCGVREREN